MLRLPGPFLKLWFAHDALPGAGKVFLVGPLVELPDLIVAHLILKAGSRADLPAGLTLLAGGWAITVSISGTRILKKPSATVCAALWNKPLLHPPHQLYIGEVQQAVEVHLLHQFRLAAFRLQYGVLNIHLRSIDLVIFPYRGISGIYILFKTGLRISEFVGLTLADLDMKNRTINIDHQLQRTSKMEYVIEATKTTSGTRVLPMTDDVYVCFERIIANRRTPKVEPMIGGKWGFLYLDKNGMPMVALHWEHYFQHICQKYNNIYKVQMSKVTPHVCRHTYCSNMAKSGMNPKTLQYLMGHSDIGVTLNTYTHLGFDDAKEELKRVANAK